MTTAPLWPTRYGQLAPRAGLAWRLGNTSVLRAGWGIFYDLGFSAATDPINGFPYNRWQFNAGDTAAPTTPVLASSTFAADLRLPYAQEWNVTFERAVTPTDVVALSYVGSAGRHLLRRESAMDAVNGLAMGSTATSHGASHFHALELEYRRRLSRGLEGVANYTWSHAIDNGSWDSAVALDGPGYSAANDRGASAFDVRHNVSAALSYESRGVTGNAFWRGLSSDWNLEGTVRARSGFPVDVLSVENLLGFGFDDYPRPDLVPGEPLWMAASSVPGGRRLNPAAFAVVTGRQGTLGRDAIAGFGMFQADLALRRRFALGESASLELGLSALNAFNHPNPADPVSHLNTPLFGQAGSMLNLMLGSGSPRGGLTPAFQTGAARSLELNLKLRF